MMPLKVFLDTEFTDFFAPKLISLGMVAATGEECYVELPFLMNECSDFVRETVLPLLNVYPDAHCIHSELRTRLLKWLEIVRRAGQAVEICFDYQTDWDLLIAALDYRVPSWITSRNVTNETNELMLDDSWQRAKEANIDHEHHALSDAKALAYAFREQPSDGDAHHE
jgi:hypothetical protein